MSSIPLVGRLPGELEDLAVGLGASRYRGRQLASWMYRRGVTDLELMSDLPLEFRRVLAERTDAGVPRLGGAIASEDGSEKLLFELQGGARVTAVAIPDGERLTLCLSTQAGCGFACAFCLTGTMGLERNLTAGEILGQLLVANARAREVPELKANPTRRVTHMVLMGMGEPLANYAAVVCALRVIVDQRLGMGYSPRRVTVSTVGLVPGIERLGRERLGVNLAVSLHATTDEVRSRLMPVNRSWGLAALLDAVRRYPLASRQRVFFEYVLLDGVNDAPEDARRLVALVRGLACKVNLIPYNDWPGAGWRRPPLARILGFQEILLEAGVTTTVRWSKGEDVGAACGQLGRVVPEGGTPGGGAWRGSAAPDGMMSGCSTGEDQ